MKIEVDIEVGDIVTFKNRLGKIVKGLVVADDKSWYVIKDHIDVKPKEGCGYILGADRVVGLVQKGAVDPKILRRFF